MRFPAHLMLVFVVACSRNRDATTNAAPSAGPTASASTTSTLVAITTPEALVAEWDRAHSAHDLEALIKLYGKSVRFFGVQMTHDECKEKLRPIVARPATQKSEDLRVSESAGRVLVRMWKKMTIDGKPQGFEAYLHLARDGTSLLIDEESDPITDKKLAPECSQTLDGFVRAIHVSCGNPATNLVDAPPPIDRKTVVTFECGHGNSHEYAIDLGGRTVTHEQLGSGGKEKVDPSPDWPAWFDKLDKKCAR